jgi:hypothetical protein
MIGNGLGRGHTRHRGSLNFDNEVTNERLVLLLFCNSVLQQKIMTASMWKAYFDPPRMDCLSQAYWSRGQVPQNVS